MGLSQGLHRGNPQLCHPPDSARQRLLPTELWKVPAAASSLVLPMGLTLSLNTLVLSVPRSKLRLQLLLGVGLRSPGRQTNVWEQPLLCQASEEDKSSLR